MMKWDCLLADGNMQKRFNEWKKEGDCCPFSDTSYSRSLHFNERREWYQKGMPKYTLWELLLKLFKTKKIEHDLEG